MIRRFKAKGYRFRVIGLTLVLGIGLCLWGVE